MHRHRFKLLSELNVVPYIDVMLVLVIIFMISAPLMQAGVNVDLPTAHTHAFSPPEQPIILTIDRHQRMYLDLGDGRKRSPAKLGQVDMLKIIQTAVKKANHAGHPRQVYLRADRSLHYGLIVNVMARLQALGIERMGLVTQDN